MKAVNFLSERGEISDEEIQDSDVSSTILVSCPWLPVQTINSGAKASGETEEGKMEKKIVPSFCNLGFRRGTENSTGILLKNLKKNIHL